MTGTWRQELTAWLTLSWKGWSYSEDRISTPQLFVIKPLKKKDENTAQYLQPYRKRQEIGRRGNGKITAKSTYGLSAWSEGKNAYPSCVNIILLLRRKKIEINVYAKKSMSAVNYVIRLRWTRMDEEEKSNVVL